MITVTIMKKVENSGGNIKKHGWKYSRREFLGGNFPDTEKYICQEISSVDALTLIFIKKIFILQIHSLRV